jgi:hypothetical protein
LEGVVNFFVNTLIEWPRGVARHLEWLGPLFARIVTGWVFLGTGWGKLTNLPLVTENFASGVMNRLGLGYEVLRKLRPDVIMIPTLGHRSAT